MPKVDRTETKVAFTPQNVLTLRPRAGLDRDLVWDDTPSSPPLFGLRVRPKGRSVYVLSYRPLGKKEKHLMRLGKVGDITLADAREAARAVLALVAKGRDPVTERRAESAESFSELAKAYVEARTEERATKTVYAYSNMIKAHIVKSPLGNKAATEITGAHVEAFLNSKRKQKTTPLGKKVGGRVAADRLYALVRATFRWALRKRRVLADPTATLDWSTKKSQRDRYLSENEVAAFWTGIESAGPLHAAAARLMLLCGTRISETLAAEWSHFDFTAAVWRLPGISRKGGEAHVVPLSAQAIRALEPLRFAAPKEARVFGYLGSNQHRFSLAVHEAAPLESEWKCHDLRRTCATGCGELGAPPHVVALILGHKMMPGVGSVTAIYDKARRVRDVAEWLGKWGAHVDGLVAAKKQEAAG